LLLLLLLLPLLCSVYIWYYYLSTRKPLSEALPAAEAITRVIKPHYLFSIYGMQGPVGVAVTPAGDRIYVTESGGQRLIRAYGRDGNEITSFAPPGSGPPSRSPVYIAIDETGQLYVSDRIRHSVDIYDAGGNFKTSLKPLTKDGWSPLGLRFDEGNLYLTDLTAGKHRVLVMDKEGALTLQFGHQGKEESDGALSFPNAVVVDAQGRLYVSDSNNGRVKVFDEDGKLLYMIPGFSLPRGMVIDGTQRLYVVDTVGQTVKVFDVSGKQAKLLFDFGDSGIGDGEFNFPNDIAIDNTGRLYIADRANNRVQVWIY